MRTALEALREIRDRISYFCARTDGKYEPAWAKEIVGIIDDVPKTPRLRNCDVGTVEEQTRRLRANCEKYKPSCRGCNFLTDIHHESCWLKWAQMPYEAS